VRDDVFATLVEEALASLPAWVDEALRNVAVLIEEEDPHDPDLYGTYDGVALPDRTGGEPVEPSRITIYRRPIVEDFATPDEIREEVRITVLHEIAHHFGIDEHRLDELGYG
jgi:predicted Zn-dependent protease with MMP-like domain